jgi:HAD superfamily hydrolase (TIGR01509 family)
MSNFPCPPTAIIFDMDGTLVDSERLWKVAESGLLARRGLTYEDEKHAPFIGMGITDYMNGIMGAYGLQGDMQSLIAELNADIVRLLKTDTQPQPGAFEMVDYVTERNIPYGIASSSSLEVINATIGSQPRWDNAFAFRTSAEEVPRGKPAPDVYWLAAERLGVNPTECIAIEDSANGARAAVAAGMTCLAVPDTSHTNPAVFAHITPHVFNSLHEVKVFIETCGQSS